jgi:hypothetical protein
MSPDTPTDAWILIKPGYSNYLAIPASVLMELLPRTKVVSEKYNPKDNEHRFKLELETVDLKWMTSDQMTVLQAQARMAAPTEE